MSDIKKDELKREIAAILKGADLSAISSKKVRQQIEEHLDCDLSSRKKEVDELVLEYIDKRDKQNDKKKKNGDVNDDEDEDDEEEEEEELDDEDDEEVKKPKRGAAKKVAAKRKSSSDESEEVASENDDDEYNPKKKAAAKKPAKQRGRKKKSADSDDDSDEDWGKGKKRGKKASGGGKRGGGGGYTKPLNLSPELAELLGETSMPRHEVVKRIWAIIKERNLYDPKNKQYAICDDALLKVFGVKRFRTFGMMKFLKNHFTSD